MPARNVPKSAQGALVSMDRDGAVRAMVGGTGLCELQLQPRHQRRAAAGLAFKLFVYLAALEAGYNPDDRMS
jgi:penicillin-binding protein 1A